MAILYLKTEEREQHVLYTEKPYINESSHLFTALSSNIESPGGLEALQDFDFFYVRGYSHGKEFDDADYLNKTAVNNELESLKRLASNRPFIGVGNKPALLYYANQAGLGTKIHFLEPAIDSSPNYLAVSRQRDNAHDIVRALSKAFDQFSQSQEYQNILRRYGFQEQ